LYYMDYEGDYGFDGFLSQGGAASEEEMANYIVFMMSGGFVKLDTEDVDMSFGCSTLSVKGENYSLMGRNYDWYGNSNAMIIHTKPSEGYESYSTTWLDFLGFGNGFVPEDFKSKYMSIAAVYVPLDGINEKGLCVADLVAGDNEVTKQNTEKADLTTTSAIRLLLDKAANVDEAIGLLSQYDMNSSIGMAHHLAISDSDGKSVVVEYANGEMIVTETDIVTNHYLAKGEKYGVGNEESHRRFEKIEGMKNSVCSTKLMADCLESVSYENETQWSIVYDKINLTLDFYSKRGFDAPLSFSLK
ncbi:MAG: carcinine hydrolase/isopenicillin-N N-acyltransferase family protein, partial [Ruminococcus sp.]|nr:carcinine hydrolase/isopenicillin-N N-acyltransferase family protein [Ruminococcus sp.]